MEEIRFKKCAKCGMELPTSNFCKQTKSRDGLHSYCKECNKRLAKASYHKNKEQKNAMEALNHTVQVQNASGVTMTKVYAHAELAKFTPRQLMEELKARGFRWEYMLEPQRKIMFDKI